MTRSVSGRLLRWCVSLVGALLNLLFAFGVDSAQFSPIQGFRTDKAIYKPGETVIFQVEFTLSATDAAGGAVRVEIWIEREISAPFRAAFTSMKANAGARQQVALSWVADKDVFGHRAQVRVVDSRGGTVAEDEAIFDVASDWIHVMRLQSIGANAVATQKVSDGHMQTMIKKMRNAYLNTLQAWTFSPAPYALAPQDDSWPFQYAKPGDEPISKERLQRWSKLLHQQGLKFIGYNETSAISAQEDWQVFADTRPQKPIAHYFAEKGMFTPNALKAAPGFAAELVRSIGMFLWDGILLDSAIAAYISTSTGLDRAGARVTTLSPGEVGYRYLLEARSQARAANPDFRFLSQNATSVSNIGVQQPLDKIYPWIAERADRLKMREYSKVVDMYTAEIDAHNEPRDGRYPLTYETMSVSLNSLVEVLGRPLMAWAFLTPPGSEKSVAFIRPYLAIHLASRTHVHDHFAYYNGAASNEASSPGAQQFIRYNRFLARFSYYLHDPELKWLTATRERFGVTSAKPLFWERTVYRKALPNGGERIVINLLNLPSNGRILNQTEIPQPASDVVLQLSTRMHPARVVWLGADDQSLSPKLLEGTVTDSSLSYQLPPIPCWGIVVIDTK